MTADRHGAGSPSSCTNVRRLVTARREGDVAFNGSRRVGWRDAVGHWRTRVGAAATTTTETNAFEVIAVTGHDLVAKLPEGTKELIVPEDFRFTGDRKSVV